MRFSRHARNEARHLRITISGIERELDRAPVVARDENGNPIHAIHLEGMIIWVVVAADSPGQVITMFRRRK